MSDVRAIFRISENDFDSHKEFLWFEEEFHEKYPNKSKFYKEPILTKIKCTKEGKESDFNKLMQFVEVLGIEKVLESIETATTSTPIDEDQISNIINKVLQTVQNKGGITLSSQQQTDILTELRSPNKKETSKLMKLADM